MIDVKNLSVQFSGNYLFENVNLKILPADRIALVGSNGSGKTTFLKLLTNKEQPETGEIVKRKGLKIGYLPQEYCGASGDELFGEVKSSLKEITDIEKTENEYHSLLESAADEKSKREILLKLGELNHLKEHIGYYEVDSNIEKILVGLGFKESDFRRNTSEFSGGWLMRIELAKILAGKNDLLLLDEPTNHLDIDSLRWLTNFLISYRGAILLVSHDRDFVSKITTRTLEIFNSKLAFFNGNLEAYSKFKEERDRQLVSQFENRKKKVKDIQNFIERFRYKATKAKQVQSRIKFLKKLDELELPEFEKEINISFPKPPRSGDVPADLIGVSKYYGANKVFENINLKIERGDKFAFVGPNGAGKTTLAKIIAGRIKPTGGKIIFSRNTRISYFAQESTEELNLENDILEEVYSSSEEFTPLQLRKLLGAFLFSDDDVFKKIKVLSGGEKSRVALAKILLTKANLIVLDEPTNHLDFNSKKVLRRALADFEGCLIIVSHDIAFVRPIVNKTLDLRGGGAKLYLGGIDGYLAGQSNSNISGKEISETARKNNRKARKRKEAELRQMKFSATKEIKNKIEKLEITIEKLENRKTELELELTKPENFSDSDKSAGLSRSLSETNKELESAYSEWSELSENLEKIENEFLIN